MAILGIGGLLGDAACGLTTGANRNAGLLATIDEPALWFDDDVEAQCAAPPRRIEGVAFGADGEPSSKPPPCPRSAGKPERNSISFSVVGCSMTSR